MRSFLQTSRSARWGMAVAVMAAATPAWATILNPGDSQWKTSASVATTPKYDTVAPVYFVPANIVAQVTNPMVGTISGTVVSTVYKDPSDNTLAFDYKYIRDNSGTAAIVLAGIGGGWADVTITAAGAKANGLSGTSDSNPEWTDGDPLYILRDPVTEQLEIQWRAAGLGTVIGKNNSSSNFWFDTDAIEYKPGSSSLISSSNSSSLVSVLAPSGVIPEPTTTLLLAAGSGLFLRRRRMA